MSKSYGNTILLSEPEASMRQKLKTMVTDPARIRRTDPGDPDKCPVGDSAQDLQLEGNDGEGVRRLPDRGDRLH
jgi:tryptophanyl-tRNA synthetase